MHIHAEVVFHGGLGSGGTSLRATLCALLAMSLKIHTSRRCLELCAAFSSQCFLPFLHHDAAPILLALESAFQRVGRTVVHNSVLLSCGSLRPGTYVRECGPSRSQSSRGMGTGFMLLVCRSRSHMVRTLFVGMVLSSESPLVWHVVFQVLHRDLSRICRVALGASIAVAVTRNILSQC